MKSFFLQSYLFWTITRFIFIIAALIDFPGLFQIAPSRGYLFIDFIALCYIILMIYNTVVELQNKTGQRITKSVVGAISIFIAIVSFYLAMGSREVSFFWAFAFAIWLGLLGVFDLVIMNRENGWSD